MRNIVRLAYNDILANGFDSVAQECYMRINKPELADEVYKRHGHAPDWEKLKRDPKGRFHHVSNLVKGLVVIAEQLDNKSLHKEADKVDELLKYIVSYKEGGTI